MTGTLERPSQDAPETRKAAPPKVERRKPASARAAVRSLHAAEQALLLAAHQAAVAQKRGAIAAAFASLLSAAEARIIAHVQGRMAGIAPSLSAAERMAEIERLKAEQDAALSRVRLDVAAEKRAALRSAASGLSLTYRRERAALAGRHVADRSRARGRARSQEYGSRNYRTPWTAVRELGARLVARRTGPRGRKSGPVGVA